MWKRGFMGQRKDLTQGGRCFVWNRKGKHSKMRIRCLQQDSRMGRSCTWKTLVPNSGGQLSFSANMLAHFLSTCGFTVDRGFCTGPRQLSNLTLPSQSKNDFHTVFPLNPNNGTNLAHSLTWSQSCGCLVDIPLCQKDSRDALRSSILPCYNATWEFVQEL